MPLGFDESWPIAIAAISAACALSAAYVTGLFFNAVYVYLLVGASVMVAHGLLDAARGTMDWRSYAQLLSSPQPLPLFSVVASVSFALAAGWLVELAIVPIQFTATAHKRIRYVLWVSVAAFIGAGIIPSNAGNLPFATLHIVMGGVIAFELLRFRRNEAKDGSVELAPPFASTFCVVQGGSSCVFNHHHVYRQQRFAVDLVLSDGAYLEHSPARAAASNGVTFGAVVLAPAPGVVVAMRDDLPDAPAGKVAPGEPAGNHVTVQIGNGRFVTLAHLQQGSVRVGIGSSVATGDQLARCGSSGRTTEPHLHLQVQDSADFYARATASLPFVFCGVEDRSGLVACVSPRRNALLRRAQPKSRGSDSSPFRGASR
jgi:hypothetical protein